MEPRAEWAENRQAPVVHTFLVTAAGVLLCGIVTGTLVAVFKDTREEPRTGMEDQTYRERMADELVVTMPEFVQWTASEGERAIGETRSLVGFRIADAYGEGSIALQAATGTNVVTVRGVPTHALEGLRIGDRVTWLVVVSDSTETAPLWGSTYLDVEAAFLSAEGR